MDAQRVHSRGLRLGAAAIALVVTVALAVAPALAATNLVADPSGVGGNITGWSAPSTWGPLTGVTKNGIWWLHWVSNSVQSHTPNPGAGWYVYVFPNLTAGQQLSCGFKAMGSGQIVLDIWTGTTDNLTAPKTLSSTPQTFTETETVAAQPWPSPPQVQVRYQGQTGNLDVYFTDVTCVVGSSVTLVADSPATSGGGSGTASTGSTAGSASSSSSLPKTGGGPLPFLGGLAALGAGLGLLRSRRRHGR